MKTNLFKVRNIRKKKITIEEDRIDNPIILFFHRYGCLLMTLLFVISFIVLLIALSLTLSNLLTSSSPDEKFVLEDIEFNKGNSNITLSGGENNDYFINKYANAYKKEGVIFVEDTFIVNGTTITYYSDGSSKYVRLDGTIHRISALKDGSYAISEDGTLDKAAKFKTITVTKIEELPSETINIYYSDGSAEITKNGKTILVRNSSNIELTQETDELSKVRPSGVSYPMSTSELQNTIITYYTDGTIKIVTSTNTYVVRNSEDINIEGNNVTFPNNNEATIIDKKILDDKTTITYYSDGSALIEAYYGHNIMVRRAADIVLEGNKSFLEILKSSIAYAADTITTPDGTKVINYKNGGAVIIHPDNSREYIDENSDIKYDENGNIKKYPSDTSKQKSKKTLPDKTEITDFDNGKSRVLTPDGEDYIIDTEDLMYDKDGNLYEDEYEIIKYNPYVDTEDDKDDDEEPDIDYGQLNATIEELEKNYYDFNISNTTKKNANYKIVIEESENYDKYGYKPLAVDYIKYNLIIDNNYFNDIDLSNNLWEYNNKKNYVLYEGKIGSNNYLSISLLLYIDYVNITNAYQDSAFIGTIKVYMEQEV